MFRRDAEKERAGGGGGKWPKCWASERKENPERNAGGYTFRRGSQRIGPADLYIFRAQTKKRWAQDAAQGFRLSIRTIGIPK